MWHYETSPAENWFQQAVVPGTVSTHSFILQLMSKTFEGLNGEIIKHSDSFPLHFFTLIFFFPLNKIKCIIGKKKMKKCKSK